MAVLATFAMLVWLGVLPVMVATVRVAVHVRSDTLLISKVSVSARLVLLLTPPLPQAGLVVMYVPLALQVLLFIRKGSILVARVARL